MERGLTLSGMISRWRTETTGRLGSRILGIVRKLNCRIQDGWRGLAGGQEGRESPGRFG